jgi:chloramphenicol-sensitive protein RarD
VPVAWAAAHVSLHPLGDSELIVTKGRVSEMNKGTWYAVGAYTIWGLLPVYWKWLDHVPALQLLSHRILWSFVALFAFIWLSRRWKVFRAAALNPRALRSHVVAAALLGINWLTYVWAVNAGFIVETSLGYFINPLLSVAMGVAFLRERLRSWQWVAIGLAAAGVLYLAFVYGSLPWIALTLALSFGFYGLLKKRAPLGSLHGLTLETGILFLPALACLLFSEMTGQGALLHTGAVPDLLMVGAGLMTTIPLLMFASAAQRIPLSLVGILQYIAPTLQFFLGVVVYGEPFSRTRLIGFGIVWAALILFAIEGVLARRAEPAAVAE